VGKNMLARMMSAFETGGNDSESRAMIQVEEDAMPALIEKSQPAQESVEKKPSFLSRLGRAFVNFLRALLRLIITLAFIAGIGAVIYFGMPFINETFIVPVEQNTARIREIETEMATLQTQLDEMSTRVDTIEQTIEAHTATIAELDKMQATLEEETTAQSNSVMIALKREIMFIRTIETLSRARLFFSQSNFGLAEADVQSARDILAELLIDAPPYQRDALNQIIIRLDLALGNMPVFPVIAVDDVDIAWQLMMMGLPESEADVIATFTPRPAPTLTATPTPEPILEVTPTATP